MLASIKDSSWRNITLGFWSESIVYSLLIFSSNWLLYILILSITSSITILLYSSGSSTPKPTTLDTKQYGKPYSSYASAKLS